MIHLPPSVRIFLCSRPADMRRSFDGLAAMTSEIVRADPMSGHLFVFWAETKGHGRRTLPEHLPRERQECAVPEDKLVCDQCGSPLEKFGEEVSEVLDYVPARFVVRQFVRPKYSCPKCHETVVTGALPCKPIDGGLAGQGSWRTLQCPSSATTCL